MARAAVSALSRLLFFLALCLGLAGAVAWAWGA
jgi:hypothetical protein